MRVAGIVARIMSLPEDAVGQLLEEVFAEFSQRRKHLRDLFVERFEQIRQLLAIDGELCEQRRLLIGSDFLAECSLESTALFNPSIVPHPDQTGLPPGVLRFILSLRATGEDTFHPSLFALALSIRICQLRYCPQQASSPSRARFQIRSTTKRLFERKLSQLRLTGEFTGAVMNEVGDSFALEELRAGIQAERLRLSSRITQEDHNAAQGIWMLARSNCQVQFQPEQQLSERIFFDATFTAFDGTVVMPELVETCAFLLFRFITLNGPAAQNKGVRKYCVGAFLLDRDDRSKLIGRLRKPLLKPNRDERGYVPNVVYTCGAIVHNGQLIIPYGLADHAPGFATVELTEVLAAME